MINQENRIENFTSSQIFRLVGTDSVRETYLKEIRAERALKRSVDLGAYSQPMTWGKIFEAFYFIQEKYFPTGSGYSLCNKTTQVHKKYKFWAGSCDVEGRQDAGEIKCFYPEKYFLLASALLKLLKGEMTIEQFKKDFKEVYWQVVSNGIILNKPKCTIFAYIPTLEELRDCILLLRETNFAERLGLDPWMINFILDADDKDELYRLPYIDTEKSDFPNEVRFTFQPPAEDIILLTKTVIESEKLLADGV